MGAGGRNGGAGGVGTAVAPLDGPPDEENRWVERIGELGG